MGVLSGSLKENSPERGVPDEERRTRAVRGQCTGRSQAFSGKWLRELGKLVVTGKSRGADFCVS